MMALAIAARIVAVGRATVSERNALSLALEDDRDAASAF
jgi:hypothetical protein